MNESGRSSCRILVVDDHANTLRIMGALLRNRGYEVDVAPSCAAAMKHAGDNRFDLLLTDFSLADGDGIDLFTRINELMPVAGILISGYDRPQDEHDSQSAGFAQYLIKPVDIEKLFNAIEQVCRQHVQTKSLGPTADR